MNIFDFRDQLIDNYSQYVTSFIQIRDSKIKGHVEQELSDGVLWPDPLMQLNPAFEQGGLVDDFVNNGLFVFRIILMLALLNVFWLWLSNSSSMSSLAILNLVFLIIPPNFMYSIVYIL